MEPNLQYTWRNWLQQTIRPTLEAYESKLFKDDISKFALHLTESSVQKTVHASPVVAECVAQLDKLIHIKRDSKYHAEPLHDQDRQAMYISATCCC